MGRRRTIDRDAVLEAAQRVVSRAGATGLTLEAVAAEAHISKASVLYDYKHKDALIRAIIEKRVAAEDVRVDGFIKAMGDAPDAVIRGLIAAGSRDISDEDRRVAISLCAAAAQNAALREPIQESIHRRSNDVASTSAHPDGALLAFLALQGLQLLEWFGLYTWQEQQRERLLADIDWLRSQTPPRTAPQDTTLAPAAATTT